MARCCSGHAISSAARSPRGHPPAAEGDVRSGGHLQSWPVAVGTLRMETRLASWLQDSAEGSTAERILRACVHCGFCLATCPTYQVLGDELDSPRGRIYQIKQVLEDVPATRATQVHLDRCLTCCSCETTCPSGVEYRHLVDIGRAAVDARVSRPIPERILRWMLKESISRPHLFAAAVRLGRAMRWTLPSSLCRKLGNLRP